MHRVGLGAWVETLQAENHRYLCLRRELFIPPRVVEFIKNSTDIWVPYFKRPVSEGLLCGRNQARSVCACDGEVGTVVCCYYFVGCIVVIGREIMGCYLFFKASSVRRTMRERNALFPS